METTRKTKKKTTTKKRRTRKKSPAEVKLLARIDRLKERVKVVHDRPSLKDRIGRVFRTARFVTMLGVLAVLILTMIGMTA